MKRKPESAQASRWKGICAYDGTGFEGWQSQPGGNTIQDILESRLAEILKGPLRIHGSARTDSGVHAKHQVFHFDAAWSHPPDAFYRALRSELPIGIQLKSLRRVPGGFHALHSATGKRYIYRACEGQANPFETRYCWSLNCGPLNVDDMRFAAELLLGIHDFTAFSATGSSPDENPVKDLRQLEIRKRGRRLDFVVDGSGFLYRMVRRLVGTLYNVGLGRVAPDEMKYLLENRKRVQVIYTAPACGLCLEKVFY